MKRLFIAIIVFFIPVFASADSADIPFKLTTSLNKEKIQIGQTLKYTIEVQTQKDVEVSFGPFDQEKTGFKIKDFGSSEKVSFFGNKKIIQWYLFDTFAIGPHEIGLQTVKYKRPADEYWQKRETDILEVKVESALELFPDEKDIRDIKGPIDIAANLKKLALIILIVLAAAGLGVFIYSFRKKKIIENIHIPTADEIAYQALDALRAKGYSQKGLIKEYYAELSLIERRYLEHRFSLRAPEMTTEEFLYQLKDNSKLDQEQKNLLKDFLSHCDMVKFAKYGPSEQEIEESFQSAKRLVDQTKEVGDDNQYVA